MTDLASCANLVTPSRSAVPMVIGLAIAAVFVVLLVIIAMPPPPFTIERSLTMEAPASTIYPHLIDFHKWAAW